MQDPSQQPQEQPTEPSERKVIPMTFGTLRNSRYAAPVVAVCLVVAIATAVLAAKGSSATRQVSLSCQKVTTTFSSARFDCTSNTPTTLQIVMGTDKPNAIVMANDRAKTHHVVTVPLTPTPGVVYVARTIAVNNDGETKPSPWMGFKTPNPGTSPATITAGTHYLLLNKQPVVLTLDQTRYPCPDAGFINGSVSMGVSVTTDYSGGGSCSGGTPSQWATQLHTILSGKLWWREPDAGPFQQLQNQKLPELVTWQAATSTVDAGPPNDGGGDAGFLGWNCRELGTLYSNAAKSGRTRPLLYWMSVATHPVRPGLLTCVTPASMAAESWIIRSQGGSIGYALADVDGVAELNPFPGAVATAHKLALQCATLCEVMLHGKSTPVTTTNSTGPVKCMGWTYNGVTYILAINTAKTAASGSFALPQLKPGGTLQVMFEGRSLKAAKTGVASDHFGGFGTHWYRVK